MACNNLNTTYTFTASNPGSSDVSAAQLTLQLEVKYGDEAEFRFISTTGAGIDSFTNWATGKSFLGSELVAFAEAAEPALSLEEIIAARYLFSSGLCTGVTSAKDSIDPTIFCPQEN